MSTFSEDNPAKVNCHAGLYGPEQLMAARRTTSRTHI